MKKYYLYRFLNIYNETIYIGRTNNISIRVRSHFTKGHLPKQCYLETKRVEMVEFKSYGDAYIYEIYLISKYKPKYNTEFVDINTTLDLDKVEFKLYTMIFNIGGKQEFKALKTNDENSRPKITKTLNSIHVLKHSRRCILSGRDIDVLKYIYENEDVATAIIQTVFFKETTKRNGQKRLKQLTDIGLVSSKREDAQSPNKFYMNRGNRECFHKIINLLTEEQTNE